MFTLLRLRLARTTPIAHVRSAGPVVVEGRVVARETLSLAFAPLPAVAVEWWIESHRRVAAGRRRPMWVALEAGVRTVPFAVEDASGRIEVAADPDALLLYAPHRDVGPLRDRRGTRWVARWLGDGDRVRIRGEARGHPEPIALGAGIWGPLEILSRG